MPTIYKVNILFDYSPLANPASVTRLRSGGWSESYYQFQQPTADQMASYGNVRAGILTPDCQIIGYRITTLNYAGNVVTQGQVLTGDISNVGAFSSTLTADPDTSLIFRGTVPGSKAQTKYILRNLPPNQITGSQFVPTAAFLAPLGAFGRFMLTPANPMYWFGRDPTQAKVRLVSYNAATLAVVTMGDPIVRAGDYARFFRVRDAAGDAVTGSYLVQTNPVLIPNTANYTTTLNNGPSLSVITPSGFIRKDVLAALPITGFVPHLVSDRKIGRPFSLFRGRRTR